MGKKSLLATAVGALGGFILGFALGFHYLLVYLIEIIPTRARLVAVELDPAIRPYGDTFGFGITSGLEDYVFSAFINPFYLYAIGGVIFGLGIFIAFKVGETSWLPWKKERKKKPKPVEEAPAPAPAPVEKPVEAPKVEPAAPTVEPPAPEPKPVEESPPEVPEPAPEAPPEETPAEDKKSI